MWTRNLSQMPNFSHTCLENHLVSGDSAVDLQPKQATRHQKLGYQLFKSCYVNGITVKPNVKMGEHPHFLVRGKVNAQMKKMEYTVYVHLKQNTGHVTHASCECPAGKGGCCKHVAALLFQLLDYKQLELTEVPVEVSCTEKLQTWNVPKLAGERKGAVLFEELLFENADFDRDQLGRKRPLVKGQRDDYNPAPSFCEKVVKSDIKRLQDSLGEDEPLKEVLSDNDCQPFDYESYHKNLPSKVKLETKKRALRSLNTEDVRNNVLGKIDEATTGTSGLTLSEEQKDFVMKNLTVSAEESREIERNTRAQADCPEWYQHREKRLTASNFGSVMNRRESVFPKTIIDRVKNNNHSINTTVSRSCKWGKENEETALLKYFEFQNNQVKVCKDVGFVISLEWPWLGASPDALACSPQEPSPYGAVEIKCPSSKVNMTIAEACQDKSFYLTSIDGRKRLKQKHMYFYQVQGIMALCKLEWIDFVVYTVKDLHVERIYFDSKNWESNMLPKLSKFFFNFLV